MKRKWLAIGIILLFVGTCIIPAIAQDTEKPLPTSRGNWLYVGGSGPGNYTRIQDAINDSSDGDTVFVFNGTYYEHVVINKIIDLIGEDKNTTIIDGSGTGDVVLVISDEVAISDFTLQNSGSIWPDSGIRLNHSKKNTIVDTIISTNYIGIYLFFSSNNTVTDSNTNSNNYSGISLYHSSNNIITGNNASYNIYGISLYESSNNIITSNNETNNEVGIDLSSYSNNNTITDNNANSNEYLGILLYSSSNNNIIGNNASYNDYSISLSNSSNDIIIGNNASHNQFTIYLSYSNNNTIIHNNVSNNFEGVTLSYSNNNTIADNNVSNNEYGIFLDTSSNNNIMRNNVSNHYRPIFLIDYGSNNHFYHNNLINYTHNAYDDGENTWDNGYPSSGNYWDSYTGNDTFWGQNQTISGSDGVGDTPYNIAAHDNKDRYPLMEPYGMTTLSLEFKGGLFKCSGIIKNIGNNTAYNVQWKIIIDGRIVLLGRESSGTIPKPLLVGEETHVRSIFILGFGKIMITIAVWADNAPYVSKTTPGKLLLFFIKI